MTDKKSYEALISEIVKLRAMMRIVIMGLLNQELSIGLVLPGNKNIKLRALYYETGTSVTDKSRAIYMAEN